MSGIDVERKARCTSSTRDLDLSKAGETTNLLVHIRQRGYDLSASRLCDGHNNQGCASQGAGGNPGSCGIISGGPAHGVLLRARRPCLLLPCSPLSCLGWLNLCRLLNILGVDNSCQILSDQRDSSIRVGQHNVVGEQRGDKQLVDLAIKLTMTKVGTWVKTLC